MKARLILALLPLVAACSSSSSFSNDVYEDELISCPKVKIKAEDRSIVQKVAGKEYFKIEMVSYNGHCYYDEKILKDKAVVSPTFKVTRLLDTNVEDVHFSYYLESAEGPARFLGKKTYFAEVRVPRGSFETFYTATPGELSIPAGVYNVDMYAGLIADAKDAEYKIKE